MTTPLTVETSAYGAIFPVVEQKADTVLSAAAKAGHEVTRVFGLNTSSESDHRFRQSVDFMHYGNTPMRLWLENYLVANNKALGVMGIISNRRCVGFPSNEANPADREVVWNGPEGQWRDYSGTSDPHTDHLHVQFNTGPLGTIATPKSTIVMYCAHNGVHGYAAPPAVGKVTHTRKRGFRLRGTIGHRIDGRYLVTKWNTWYPMGDLTDKRP